MPFDFVLPDLGEGTTEGEVRKWVIREGDAIDEHQTVLEIETDKAVVEVPSPKKGTVTKIHRDVGEIVKVGEVLVTIALEGEAAPKEEKPETKERPKSVSVVGVLPDEEEEDPCAPCGQGAGKGPRGRSRISERLGPRRKHHKRRCNEGGPAGEES